MNKKIKAIILLSIAFCVFGGSNVFAKENIFKAQVKEVQKEVNKKIDDGTVLVQQKLELLGLEGEHKNKVYQYNGVSDSFDLLNKKVYKKGDVVMVLESFDDQGVATYYVVDYVRDSSIFVLFIVFVIVILLIARLKGLRALLSLFLTFVVIVKYLIPQILAGANTVMVTIIGSVVILLIIIYITEGFKPLSHLAVASIFLSLLISIFSSWLFVNLAHLSGLSGEESSSLLNLGSQAINFKGLLLAGIIIGLLGVLDDVVIAQVSTVEQLHQANPSLNKKDLFKKANKVGVSHISSMTNTLFLAYAGVSLPLLILFVSGQSAFQSFRQVINNEAIATEIVRTLSGSIGLVLAIPVATILSVWWYKRN